MMHDDGIPVYVRQVDAPGLTIRRRQYVYETDLSTTPGGCPIYSSIGSSPADPPRKVICQITSNINESGIWCAECGGEASSYTRLKKAYASMATRFSRVWHDTGIPNMTTGRVESDPRKFAAHLREKSEEMGERLGIKVDYQPVDLTDKDALGVTDEGMDATHDRAVAEGRKDSRGRFLF